MIPVFKREFRAYFYTPLGYVFIAAYYLFTGFFFFNYNLYGNSGDMRSLFSILFTVNLFLIPVLTMRLMSEDRRMKTDMILLMSQAGGAAIVLGKFLAALCVYLIGISGALAGALIVEAVSSAEWPVIGGHFAGLFFLGFALIAIGMFISSLTENQLIAAVGGYCFSFLLMLLDSVGDILQGGVLTKLLRALSFRIRYQPFSLGVFGLDNAFFFITAGAFFIFLAAGQFEKRRWG